MRTRPAPEISNLPARLAGLLLLACLLRSLERGLCRAGWLAGVLLACLAGGVAGPARGRMVQKNHQEASPKEVENGHSRPTQGRFSLLRPLDGRLEPQNPEN